MLGSETDLAPPVALVGCLCSYLSAWCQRRRPDFYGTGDVVQESVQRTILLEWIGAPGWRSWR